MKTSEILLKMMQQRCLDIYGVDTKYRVAKALDTSCSTVSRWLHGVVPDDASGYKIARFLGLNPIVVIVLLQAERCQDSPQHDIWEEVSEIVTGVPFNTAERYLLSQIDQPRAA